MSKRCAKYSKENFKTPYDIPPSCSCYSPAITSTSLPLRAENARSEMALEVEDRQRDKAVIGLSSPPIQWAVSD